MGTGFETVVEFAGLGSLWVFRLALPVCFGTAWSSQPHYGSRTEVVRSCEDSVAADPWLSPRIMGLSKSRGISV